MDLSAFNPRQKEAVTLSLSPDEVKDILIVAGAGSGKTRVLIHRIAHLLENEVMPSEILGMTFTKKAANEMQSRLNGLFGQKVPVKLSTFHSLSADLLRTYLPVNFTIIDDSDQTRLLRKVIKLISNESKEKVSLKDFKLWLGNQRNQCLDPSESSPEDSTLLEHYRRISSLYTDMKKSLGQGAYDFDDLLEQAVLLLKNNNQVRNSIHARWKYILVDEYQDTNKRQFELLTQLRGPNAQMLQVGDEDQLIYSWRGADIDHILSSYEASKKNENVHCIFLSENYRCSENILSVGNAILTKNLRRTGKSLTAFKPAGEPVELLMAPDSNEEAYELVRRLRGWNADGINYDDMALLMRVNRMSKPIERALIEYGIPYQLHNGVALFDSPEARAAMALLFLTENPGETFYMEQVFDLIKVGVGPATLTTLDEAKSKSGLTWPDYLATSKFARKENVQLFLTAFDDAKDWLSKGELSLCLNAYISQMGLLGFFKEEDREKRGETLDVLMGVLEDYERYAKIRNTKPSVVDFQEQRLLNDSLLDQNESGKVHLMSIHKAKGLEFKCGAVVGLQDGVFPRVPEECDLEEERRLAYVATTRFMDSLVITQAFFRPGFPSVIPYSTILSDELVKLKEIGAISVTRD